MNLNNLMPKLMGFIVILLTLALGPIIYTANSAILLWGVLDPFVALEVIVGFGGFLIILGLLVSAGLFTIAGVKGKTNGMRDLMAVIGSVVLVVVMLTVFPTLLDYVDDLITAAVAAGDTIGEFLFGIIPLVYYLGILAIVAAPAVMRMKRGKGSKAVAYA